MRYIAPIHGKLIQLASTDTFAPLNDTDTKFIQQVVGVFLYYARTIDSTMLAPISKISSRQAKPTQDLLKDVNHFLQYAAHHPDATLIYQESPMILTAHSDASFLQSWRIL